MICSTTGGTENSRKWSRTYLLTCCPRSVERINIGFAVSRLRHGANERCGTNLREPGGMGQTVVDGDGRGESGPRATPADGKRQSSGADPRPREHPSQWIPVRQRRELHAADGDLG